MDVGLMCEFMKWEKLEWALYARGRRDCKERVV